MAPHVLAAATLPQRMLSQVERVRSHDIDRPGEDLTARICDRHRDPVAGEPAQGIAQREPTCGASSGRPSRQPEHARHRTHRQDRLTPALKPEQQPVLAQVEEFTLHLQPGEQAESQRRTHRRGEPGPQLHTRPLTPGSVGHLGVTLTALLRAELCLKVIKELVPPHGRPA